MGFFDGFKAGVEEQRERLSDSRKRMQERRDGLAGKSDGDWLGMMNSAFTSEDDRLIVDRLLKECGYAKNGAGKYSRP